VTAVRSFIDDAPLYSAEYRRDPAGRIDQRTESHGGGAPVVTSYSYAPNGWLLSATAGAGAGREDYGYDPNGNRVSATGLTGTPVYDAQDRLLVYGTNTFTYTGNGELASLTTDNSAAVFVYDGMTNLRSVQLTDGRTVDYLIDGENRRVGRRVEGVLVQGFLYLDAQEPVAELDPGGAVVAEFAYLDGSTTPAFILKGGATYGVLADPNGSVRLVVDTSTGAVVQRRDYDTFGNTFADTNPGFQPFGFAGGIDDPDTGLVRFGNRDYDAATGRWTAKDPLLFAGGSANLYLYAHNDPVNTADPSGNEPEKTQKEKDWDKIKEKMKENSYDRFDDFKKDWDKFKNDHWNWLQRNNPWDSGNAEFLTYFNQANSYVRLRNWNTAVGP
jgi:RHS repeat-associated protein